PPDRARPNRGSGNAVEIPFAPLRRPLGCGRTRSRGTTWCPDRWREYARSRRRLLERSREVGNLRRVKAEAELGAAPENVLGSRRPFVGDEIVDLALRQTCAKIASKIGFDG